jgi:hypothetical protein
MSKGCPSSGSAAAPCHAATSARIAIECKNTAALSCSECILCGRSSNPQPHPDARSRRSHERFLSPVVGLRTHRRHVGRCHRSAAATRPRAGSIPRRSRGGCRRRRHVVRFRRRSEIRLGGRRAARSDRGDARWCRALAPSTVRARASRASRICRSQRSSRTGAGAAACRSRSDSGAGAIAGPCHLQQRTCSNIRFVSPRGDGQRNLRWMLAIVMHADRCPLHARRDRLQLTCVEIAREVRKERRG